jgi:hypothetical protein
MMPGRARVRESFTQRRGFTRELGNLNAQFADLVTLTARRAAASVETW